MRVARAGLRVAEVPSFEYKRIHGVSNLNATRDGLRVIRTIFAERHRSRHPKSEGAPLEAMPVVPVLPVASPQATAVEESIG